MSIDDLAALYAELNVQLFDGALPTLPFEISRVEPNGHHGEDGSVRLVPRKRPDGLWDITMEHVSVSESILAEGGLPLRRALLHEMAHVAACRQPSPLLVVAGDDLGHDGAFLAELEGLHERGEEWAAEEIGRYDFGARDFLDDQDIPEWVLLRDQAQDDEDERIGLDGWEERVRQRTGKTVPELECIVTGVGFWYRWHRREWRAGQDVIARLRLA